MIKCIIYLLAALLLAGWVGAEREAPARVFNTQEFVGLVSTEVGSYEDAVLDYELDASKDGVLHFTRCTQVEAVDAGDIEASQYPLFKLLSVNCLALKRYVESVPAQRSYFPEKLTKELVAAFPATAVPRISDEEMTRRQGKNLTAYEAKIKISLAADGSVQVMTATDEMTYYIMARADFDGDGAEDLLVRVDWHARNAFGRGTDLFFLAKTSDSGPVTVSWRF